MYDLIVIGGGPIGLSTAYHAAQRGLKTLVIEKFSYFNNFGSSAGHSRQFRLQYEQQYMSELCLASQNFWDELQRHTPDTLIGDVGSLWFGQDIGGTQEGGITDAKATMDILGIPYTPYDNAAAIEEDFEFKNLPSEYFGFVQNDGGIINIKATEQALFNAALDSGNVEFKDWETVINIDPSVVDQITITTQRTGEDASTQATYTGSKLAITTGAYINNSVQSLGVSVPILIWQMASAYFKKTDPAVNFPTWFVFQEAEDPNDPRTATNTLLYGFPEVDWAYPGYIRVATDFYDYNIIYNPDDRHVAPSPESLEVASSWVSQFMPGLDPTPYFTTSCLIALCDDAYYSGEETPQFFLDYMSDTVANNKNIVTYTAGWAGKFIPIMGDMICQMLADENLTEFTYPAGETNYTIPRSHFAIKWQTL